MKWKIFNYLTETNEVGDSCLCETILKDDAPAALYYFLSEEVGLIDEEIARITERLKYNASGIWTVESFSRGMVIFITQLPNLNHPGE